MASSKRSEEKKLGMFERKEGVPEAHDYVTLKAAILDLFKRFIVMSDPNNLKSRGAFATLDDSKIRNIHEGLTAVFASFEKALLEIEKKPDPNDRYHALIDHWNKKAHYSFIPIIKPLGYDPTEQIKAIVAIEVAKWNQRPEGASGPNV